MPQISPKHIFVNGVPVQVRGWRQNTEEISFKATFRGSRAAEEFARLVSEPAMIAWDEQPEYEGTAQITGRSTAGEGPTAVHRHDVVIPAPPVANVAQDSTGSSDDQLAALRQEVAALRTEVAQLRALVLSRAQHGASHPYSPGVRTLIEEDIDTGDLS